MLTMVLLPQRHSAMLDTLQLAHLRLHIFRLVNLCLDTAQIVWTYPCCDVMEPATLRGTTTSGDIKTIGKEGIPRNIIFPLETLAILQWAHLPLDMTQLVWLCSDPSKVRCNRAYEASS